MNRVFKNVQVGFSFILREGKKDVVYYLNSKHEVKKRELVHSTIFSGREGQELYADILKTVSANYRWSGDIVEVFDPEVEEYEDVQLPIYDEAGTYLGMKLLENLPTIQMVEKAKEHEQKKIQSYNFMQYVQNGLKFNKNNICTVVESYFEIMPDYVDNNRFCVICIASPYKNKKYLYLVVDKNMAKKKVRNGILYIQVPKKVVDFVLGKNRLCSRYIIAQRIGIKRVVVKAV